MSDFGVVAIALAEEEFNLDEKEIEKLGLTWIGANYEDDNYWIYKIKKARQEDKYAFQSTTEKGIKGKESYYGVLIAGTWNAAIPIEDFKDKIKEARKLFKELTEKDGKLIFVGSQT